MAARQVAVGVNWLARGSLLAAPNKLALDVVPAAGGLTSKIHAVVDTDTHQSDLGAKSTRAGADGTQARAGLSRSKSP